MRFVIQNHSDKTGHFDFMIELKDSNKLLTLKILPQDFDHLINGKKIKAERLPDHRKEYLDYEGPVSSGRGSVKIFDSGICETVLYSEDKFEFDVSGRKFTGKISANRIDGDEYNVQYEINF